MHFCTLSSVLLVAVWLADLSWAIRTVPTSACAAKCGNINATKNTDIVCTDADYGTPTGQVFAECITCQLNSTAVDPATGDTDLKWLLYNLRFATSICLWGFPNNSYVQNTPCITSRACGPFQGNIQYNALSPNISTHDYCPNLPQQDARDKCSKCLQQLGSDTYLSNFFTTIIAGCQNQTRLKITLDGSLFGNAYVNVTDDTASSPAASQVDQGPFSLGTKIGIAIGGICVLLALTGLTIICIGKRRRRAQLAARARATDDYLDGAMGRARIQQVPRVDTKWAAQAQASVDESPLSASGYGTDKHFSPYSSKYSSPISARDAQPVQMWEWPLQSPGGARPGQMQEAGGWEMEKMEREREWAGEAARRGFTVAPDVTYPPPPMRAGEDRVRQEWAMEAASRGFTVAPTLAFPPPPTRAKK